MLNSKTWIITGITLTLVLGCILGMVLDRSIKVRHRDWATKGLMQEALLSRLSRKLDLTRPQIQAIGGILRMQAIKLKIARDGFRSQLKVIKEETMEKIKPHLTKDQLEKYKKLVESHRKRWGKICQKR